LADLIIPATLRIWLVFLFVFFLLGYPVPFSIVFGGIGGLAGGVASAWWQIKGGIPMASEERRPGDNPESASARPPETESRWAFPFLKKKTLKQRYYNPRVRKVRGRRTR
jgi:hypothetical protein